MCCSSILIRSDIFQEHPASESAIPIIWHSNARKVSILCAQCQFWFWFSVFARRRWFTYFRVYEHVYIIYIIRVTIVTEALHERKVLVVTTILLNQQNGVCRWHCTNSGTTVYPWHGISATEGDKQIICTWYFKLLVSTQQNNNAKFWSFTRRSSGSSTVRALYTLLQTRHFQNDSCQLIKSEHEKFTPFVNLNASTLFAL